MAPATTIAGVTVKVSILRLVRSGERLEPPSPAAADDLAPLVRRCRQGDGQAIETLLIALGPPMLQVVRRVLGARHPDVEDTLQ